MLYTPETLYKMCINVATNNKLMKKEYRELPDHVLFDYYYKMFTDKRLCPLALEFSDFDLFCRILKVKRRRIDLLRCFQGLIEHSPTLMGDIIDHYEWIYVKNGSNVNSIDLGMHIGTFFVEGAWYKFAYRVFNVVESICLKSGRDRRTLMRLLDCYHRRIYVETSYCMFDEADNTFNLANKIVDEFKLAESAPNLAGLYANFSKLYSMKSQYDESYNWAKKALDLLEEDLSPRIIIDVLRQSARSCVFKRQFGQATLLIEQALLLSERLFRPNDPNYASVLMDYGFYLLNYDNIEQSVIVYKQALTINKDIFGKNNIHVAVAYEDLSYALYVNEYSSGKFYYAREFAEKALKIMQKLYPYDHHALASIKRVKALILEEIAVDLRDPLDRSLQEQYLKESEQLHKSALDLSLGAFGERNVQTAKHYGNLGRLYQSMEQFEMAERMHLQAISIKEQLLGKEDFEVGLSIGHLASLYNFHMKRYEDAEKLYLQSIAISLKLFGNAYSGLEYDYRGLINVYKELKDTVKLGNFINVMRDWKNRRKTLNGEPKPAAPMMNLRNIVEHFYKLC